MAGLLVVAAIGVFIWYRTGGLDRLAKSQIESALAEMNIRTEISNTHVGLRPGIVVLEDVKLYPGEETTPLASVDNLTVKFDVTSLWSFQAKVNSVDLQHPVINVRFDEQGHSNLDPIDWPERPKDVEQPSQQLTYEMAKVAIQNGQLNYNDLSRQLDGTLDNLVVSLAPKDETAPGGGSVRRLELTFSNSNLAYQGRQVGDIGANLLADITGQGATVEQLTLSSPLGDVAAKGTVTDWSNPSYAFDVSSTVALERVGYVADPNAGITGKATLSGRLTGTGTDYKFAGDLNGDNLLVAGVRLDGLTTAGTLQGERLDYTWIGELMASRLTMSGFDASGLRFKGNVTGSGADATVNGSFSASRVAGDGFTASGFDFDGTFETASLTAAGDVNLSTVALRTVRAGSIHAKVTANPDRVDVEQFTANVYGGSVSGTANAQLGGGGTSSLEAQFRGVDVDQALNASSPDAPRIQGQASGTVNLTWPGMNVRAASGKVNATVNGNLPGEEGQQGMPLDGEISLTATPGKFRIDRAEFRSGESRISAEGTIGWNRESNISVSAEAANGGDLLDLVSAANPAIASAIRQANLSIGGQFSFNGNVTGSLSNPNVTGDVSVGDVRLNEADLGTFTGSLRRENGALAIENAMLRHPGGGQVTFDVTVPSRAEDTQVVSARISQYPLDTLVKAPPFPPPLFLQGLGGVVNGTVQLQLPQGQIENVVGTVDVSVAGAHIDGQPVRDLTLAANLGADRVSLTSFHLATDRGALTATGYYPRDGGTFQAAIDAQNVDLKLIEEATASEGKPPAVTFSGTASGTVTVEGRVSGGIPTVNSLAGNVTGSDVLVNGEPVGNPRLVIDTARDPSIDQNVATVRLSADVRGAERDLTGRIFIQQDEYPFEVALALQNTDVTKFVASPPPGVSTSLTGNINVAGRLGDLTSVEGITNQLDIDGRLSQTALMVDVEGGKRYELTNRGDVVFTAQNGVLEFQKTTFTGEGTELSLEGGLAFKPEATSNLTLAGDINLALLSSFVRDTYATGVASLEATLGGTLADPRFRGFADVRDAGLRVVGLPVSIQNGQGRILFTANQALIDSFTAQANGGRVRLDGGVLFAGLQPSRWRFGINAEQVRLTYPEDIHSVIDGDLSLQGNRQLQLLSGTVNLRRAEFTRDIDINDILNLQQEQQRGSFDTAGGGAAPGSPIRLDLRIEARDSLIIRNNLADVVASASLVVTGSLDNPIVDGRATVTRGTINFRNGDYQVTRGVVRFPGRLGGDITFDLQAESEIKGYRVSIGLSGTPDKPYPVLRSEPPLPETQVLSLILTGDLGATELSAQSLTQSGVGLASSLLSEAVSRSVEKRTSRLFGINRFQIDPLVGGANPSARLTLGRQVNKNLSIIYSTNVTSGQEQVIQVEYRISDRFSVVATRDERGAFGLDFRVRKRF